MKNKSLFLRKSFCFTCITILGCLDFKVTFEILEISLYLENTISDIYSSQIEMRNYIFMFWSGCTVKRTLNM